MLHCEQTARTALLDRAPGFLARAEPAARPTTFVACAGLC
jgi:hypothetical protein